MERKSQLVAVFVTLEVDLLTQSSPSFFVACHLF